MFKCDVPEKYAQDRTCDDDVVMVPASVNAGALLEATDGVAVGLL